MAVVACCAVSRGWSAFVVKKEGSQWESAEDTDTEQLGTAQLYCHTAEWGRACGCYGKG